MAKKPEKPSVAIPLPDTVVTALSPIRKEQCVKHSVKLQSDSNVVVEESPGREPKLISENHAFYVGKIIPPCLSERLKQVMGWGDRYERIYNKEFIRGTLSYLFEHLEEGEKARVVVCRSLSEMMNGPKDVEDALSTEEEIELIKRIAEKKFQKGEESLEVVDLEKLPHHKELFERLRSGIDPETGLMDMTKALETETDEAEAANPSSSLSIARQLYKAAQKSEQLSFAFYKAMPARLKNEESGQEDSSAQYYALAEVAIRLSDIINGWKIQGGSERQAVYNGIIIQLIKGGEGRYKDVPELQELFKLLEGAGFETLSLDRKDNYYHQKKVQTAARTRLGIYAALALSLVTASFGVGRWYEGKKEKEKQAEIERGIIRNRLRYTQFRIDGKYTVPEEYNPSVFRRLHKRAMLHLKSRYNLDDDRCEALAAFLKSYLLRNKRVLPSIYGGNRYLLIDLIDGFVQENEVYFKEKGIEVGKPYQKLQRFIPEFKKLLTSDEDLVVSESAGIDYTGPSSVESQKKMIRIGGFYSGAMLPNKFEFYVYTDEKGREHLVAFDPDTKSANNPLHIKHFTSKRARLGAWQFLYAMQRFNILPLQQIGDGLTFSRSPADFQRKACHIREENNNSVIRNLYEPLRYRNAETGTRYNIFEVTGVSPEEKISFPCVLAATDDDARFTFKRGVEVAKRYHRIMNDWYRYRMNDIDEKPSGE